MTLPWLSEIVTIVLLNEEWMCATPEATFLNSRFLRALGCFLAANAAPKFILAPRHEPGVSSPRPASPSKGDPILLPDERRGRPGAPRRARAVVTADDRLYRRRALWSTAP